MPDVTAGDLKYPMYTEKSNQSNLRHRDGSSDSIIRCRQYGLRLPSRSEMQERLARSAVCVPACSSFTCTLHETWTLVCTRLSHTRSIQHT